MKPHSMLHHLSLLLIPTVMIGCARNRVLETVLVDDSAPRNAGASESTAAPSSASAEDGREGEGPASSTDHPRYATAWSDADDEGAPASAALDDSRDGGARSRSPRATNPRRNASTNLAGAGSGARSYGDAPSAGLDSNLTPDAGARRVTLANRLSRKDAQLNLFGEVDGLGGLPGQFAAQESIEQISFATDGADFDPSVDVTGEYILYASTQHSDTADIYRKSVEGTTVTRLTNDPSDDMMPAYSPDNEHIAFSSNRGGNWDIWVMTADGGPPVQITDDPEHEIHPSWSPDGKHLVYSRLSEASGRWEMWLTEFANPSRRRFLTYGLFPKWCPDPSRNKIVYQQARERGSRLFSVWTIDIENGEARRPTEIASAANAACVNPSWSFDGRMITFATIVNPDEQDPNEPQWADVWVVGIDGRGRANLTNGEFTNLQPCFGPDGRVFFISDRSGVDNIWSLWPDESIRTARGGVDGEGGGRRDDLAEVTTEQ